MGGSWITMQLGSCQFSFPDSGVVRGDSTFARCDVRTCNLTLIVRRRPDLVLSIGEASQVLSLERAFDYPELKVIGDIRRAPGRQRGAEERFETQGEGVVSEHYWCITSSGEFYVLRAEWMHANREARLVTVDFWASVRWTA
jgi:hypothetical protein